MASEKTDVLVWGPEKSTIVDGLSGRFTLHKVNSVEAINAVVPKLAPHLRAIAISLTGPFARVDEALMATMPKLEIVSSFGVGYDHIDAAWAGQHGIIATHTPDVLNEEVADTAMGLLLCTVRQLPQADRFVRRGDWPKDKDFPHTQTLRDRTVGIVGLGRIGKAVARRLDASNVAVVYHGRNKQPDVAYRYYADLFEMARDVDVLMVITPGGSGTRHLINARVLEALGPSGIVINVARGSVIDEAALIEALQKKKIYSAGLDVFANEPNVPQALVDMEQVVLLPHVGSASLHTRQAMDQLVVDNLFAWADGKPPLTPVPETPWRGKWSRRPS
jgi:lactate dehydrogenase-like 2-hydroxyacid dehydrogenase